MFIALYIGSIVECLGVSGIHLGILVATGYSLIGVSIAKLDIINIMNINCVSELKFCTQTLNIGEACMVAFMAYTWLLTSNIIMGFS